MRNKPLIVEEIIIKSLFPYNPELYINTFPEIIPDSEVTISIHDESLQTDIDRTYCYAYTFYERFDTLCLPTIFCITSQFPFYSLFRELVHKILCEFEKDIITIPMEIQIFNLINCLPPPITHPVVLSLQPKVSLTQSFSELRKGPQEKMETDLRFSQNLTNKKVIKYKFQIPDTQYICSIDYNLTYLLQVLSSEIITKLIILSFVEVNIVIFDKDQTRLNNIIQMISFLFAPFIENQFFSQLFSINPEEIDDVNSKTVGKPFSTILGINDEYSSEISVDNFVSDAICVVSINNQKKPEIIMKSKEYIDEKKNKIDQLIIYEIIENAIKQKNTAEIKKSNYEPNSPFEKIIINLYSKIKTLSLEANAVGKIQYTSGFCQANNFSEEMNNKLQNIAYSFFVEMFSYLHSNQVFKSNYNEQDFNENNKAMLYTTSKYEVTEISIDSHSQLIYKFGSFKINHYNRFLSNSLVEKHIPIMTILDCFIQFKRYSNKELPYYKIISQAYSALKKEKKIEELDTITYNDFNDYYDKNLKLFFKKEMSKDPYLFRANITENTITNAINEEYQYTHKELSKNIVYEYCRYLKSLSMDELIAVFPFFQKFKSKKPSNNYKFLFRQVNELIMNNCKQDATIDILSIILNVSILTIDELLEKSPFFYIMFYVDKYPSVFLYYYLLDIISALYIHIKHKIVNGVFEIKREMDTLRLILDFMVAKQIIPNKDIMEKIDELFLIEAKTGGDFIREKKDYPVSKDFQSIYKTVINVTMKDKKEKEMKNIITNYSLYNLKSYHEIVCLTKVNDKQIIAEAKIQNLEELKKNSRTFLNNFIISGKPLLPEQKENVKAMVVNVIAYLYANDSIKVDLSSLLDYLN